MYFADNLKEGKFKSTHFSVNVHEEFVVPFLTTANCIRYL